MNFNVISCQFALHYAFDSSKSASHTIKEIADRLVQGGYFFGTIPNSSTIKSMALKHKESKECNSNSNVQNNDTISFGNSLYDCKIDNIDNDFFNGDPFGKSYIFSLKDSIDSCPEYLIEFSLLRTLAEEHDLELVLKLPFREFYEKFKYKHKKILLQLDIVDIDKIQSEMNLKLTEEELEIAGKKNKKSFCSNLFLLDFYLAFCFRKGGKEEKDEIKKVTSRG